MKIFSRSLIVLLTSILCIIVAGDNNVFAMKKGKKGKSSKGGKSSSTRARQMSEVERKLSSESPHVLLKTFEDIEKFIRLMRSKKYTADIDISVESVDLFCFDDMFEKFMDVIKSSTNIKKISLKECERCAGDREIRVLKQKKYDEISRRLLEGILQNPSIVDFSLPGFDVVTRDGVQSVNFNLDKLEMYSYLLNKALIQNPLIKDLKLSGDYVFWAKKEYL